MMGRLSASFRDGLNVPNYSSYRPSMGLNVSMVHPKPQKNRCFDYNMVIFSVSRKARPCLSITEA
jgi:hypothetical protein